MEEVFKKDKDKSTGINFDKYDATPVELTGKNDKGILPLTSFRETRGVHPLLMENIIRVEYEKPTPGTGTQIVLIRGGMCLTPFIIMLR